MGLSQIDSVAEAWPKSILGALEDNYGVPRITQYAFNQSKRVRPATDRFIQWGILYSAPAGFSLMLTVQ